jgi:TRAP-type C4-dicarboxylate transport system substrate-binding protein
MTTRHMIVPAAVAALLASAPVVYGQDGKATGNTYVMKLSTASVNDAQHEFLKRFAAAVEKDSGGRIKGEIYPASQLGSIPRQIEGTQFGSIQGWLGPPEFLVGVDERYQALSAPGLFTSWEQDIRVINDAPVRDMLFNLGLNKGLVGLGIFMIGPSAIITRKPIHHLADYKGMKIRVLASPFQGEMINRMDASPVAMTLGDVLPALQQGAIDGALTPLNVFTTMHYQDAAKYVVETGQPHVNPMLVMNAKWVDALPPDLQKTVRDDSAEVSKEIVVFARDFWEAQRKVWVDSGGELTTLPADEQAAMIARISSIGNDLSKDKPALDRAVTQAFESAARNK